MLGESDETGAVHRKRHSRRPDLAIAAIAGCQHGVISLAQLISIGLSPDEIRHRVALGWLRPIHRCVFAVGYEPLTREGYWWAAILATGEGTVLSHMSAAALWRLLPEDDEVHVTVPGTQRRRHDGVTPHRNILDKAEITTHRGIPTTTPLRTIIDLAAMPDPCELERAIRQAEYEHLTTAAAVLAAIERRAGCRGTRKLRDALLRVTEAPGVTRSKLERRFLEFLRKHALPKPKLNVVMKVGERWIEVDCLWEEQRVIVELDGRSAHTTSAAFESDRARDAALQAVGYRVIRVTWRRLHDDAISLAGQLRALLAQ